MNLNRDKINYFRTKRDPDRPRTRGAMSHSLKFKWGIGKKGRSQFLLGGKRERESKEGEKEREHSNLLSPIPGVLSVGIRRAKSESSSTRRGLRVGTKNEGFHRRSKGRDFRKSKFSGLGSVLETSFGSTTLQEVGVLSTLV